MTALAQALRSQELLKPPGVAETIDWAEALDGLGASEVERARGLDLAAVLAARGA